MSVVGPTVPFHTDANGVLSAVYDPTKQALRVSNAGGGVNPSYTLLQSAVTSLRQIKGDYIPSGSILTGLRFRTARWQQVELMDLNTAGFGKYYAQMTVAIGVTDSHFPRTMNAAMFQATYSNSGQSGIGWTASNTSPTVNTTGAILQSTAFGSSDEHQTPLMECDLFTGLTTSPGKVGWCVWTDDPLQAFLAGRIAVYGHA